MKLTKVCAFYLRANIKKIMSNGNGEKDYNILILQKEGFLEDMIASLKLKRCFNLYTVNRRAIKALAAGILHPTLDNNNYCINEHSIELSKLNYKNFIKSSWMELQKMIKFNAVLTGNFAYYAEREMAAGLEEIGIPFIALHKENIKSPGRVEFYTDVYKNRRGPFGGRKILVYNHIEKNVQLNAGVITNNRIVVTGMPRLDKAHEWRKQQNNKLAKRCIPQVLFFSFRARVGLPLMARKAKTGVADGQEYIGNNLDELNWQELYMGTHQSIIQLAKDHSDIRVVIKSKGAKREISALERILMQNKRLPKNLEIVTGGDPFDLLTQTDVVCGFNTTGLIEALAMGIPVVIPWFGETLNPHMQPYILDLEDSVDYARSKSELSEKLLQYAMNPVTPPNLLSMPVRHMLDKWVGNSDGRAGERVYRSLLEELA